MALSDEIKENVETYLGTAYEVTDAYVVPDKEDLTFGRTAKKLKATALYIDMRDSRNKFDSDWPLDSCKIHKSFLYAAAKCIRNRDGFLRSFNGDSILAFFRGDDSEKRAVKAAMNIKWVIQEIINPLLNEKYIKLVDFGIGIGRGDIYVVKGGVGGDPMHQDLIWLGWAVYHAFEYANKAQSPNNIWISKNVFDQIKNDDSMRYSNGDHMWVYSDDEKFSFGEVRVYKTSYRWSL